MKQLILFLAFTAMGSGATFEPGLRIKFGIGPGIGKSYYFDMPRTVAKAIQMGWSKTTRPISPLPSLVMYCEEFKTICCLYDPYTNFIGGMQIAIPLDRFTEGVFDFDIQGFIPWTVPGVNCSQPVKYMTKQIFFINEKTLLKSKRQRLNAAKENKTVQENQIWVTDFYKKLLAIPTNAAGIVNTGFTKQNCVPGMGMHYFYNMTTQTECKADTLSNWFILTESDLIIGVGFIIVGVVNKPAEKTETPFYLERPAKANLLISVKDCPDCFAALAENPTGTSLHVYFIDKPETLRC